MHEALQTGWSHKRRQYCSTWHPVPKFAVSLHRSNMHTLGRFSWLRTKSSRMI